MTDAAARDRLPLWRAALAGGALALILAATFWATAAADALPAGAPDFVRDFTPASGMARLVAGLAFTALTGGVLGVMTLWAARVIRGHGPPPLPPAG